MKDKNSDTLISEANNDHYGVLYIVATPIGNLGDISQRAIETLSRVDYVAAEDTRHSARLINHLNITASMIAYHDYSDERRLKKICQDLLDGQSVALISDAGTPLISDPGYQLVKLIREQGIQVVPIPGACALISALSAAGLPTDRFAFEGFLPAKGSSRKAYLQLLARDSRTLVFYESTHRLLDSLEDMSAIFGDERSAVIARELTKTFETITSGSIRELIDNAVADKNQRRGEFVIMVHGYKMPENEITIDQSVVGTMMILLKELPIKQAAAIGAKLTGLKKRDLYQWALDNKQK
ncbi:MAG: 16S rRNA (cytidine1402-2'-O)-methyltransferase [Cellvibrionaceae bacterium]|jgi:16S rRNA (cytidine1402-2'-O)-methyltransferase